MYLNAPTSFLDLSALTHGRWTNAIPSHSEGSSASKMNDRSILSMESSKMSIEMLIDVIDKCRWVKTSILQDIVQHLAMKRIQWKTLKPTIDPCVALSTLWMSSHLWPRPQLLLAVRISPATRQQQHKRMLLWWFLYKPLYSYLLWQVAIVQQYLYNIMIQTFANMTWQIVLCFEYV